MKKSTPTAEHKRLEDYREQKSNWKHWGPYLAERAWGTVREDYSANGDAWHYLSHKDARSTAYRWNEDGLAGICDRNQYLCLSLALWNGKDPILKERLFGLTGPQGNHGEDVKEYYFYLDSTPTHSYMKMLYKYPQSEFPYQDLLTENARLTKRDFEYELLDTGVFDENRYFDVFIEFAKAAQNDILLTYTVHNRGPETAGLHLIPTLWCRNTWSWGYPSGPMSDVPYKPEMTLSEEGAISISHPALGDYKLYVENGPEILFTENETTEPGQYGKDAFHRYLIEKDENAVNPENRGTKACAVFRLEIEPGKSQEVRCRLVDRSVKSPFRNFNKTFQTRKTEADEFYKTVVNSELNEDEQLVQRQALAGMLWTKQLYYYDVEQWLSADGERLQRRHDRNAQWNHLANFDIISMPDKWEYPWYATWDLAFHCLPLAMVDLQFAKRQLELVTREWYMHPNGQLPAYEWNFNDVNPPTPAWGVWRLYQMEEELTGKKDRAFLEGLFHKLLLNFTWWVNRKDETGRNIFQGGFLGLDNISVFDRSASLPEGGRIDQADGTAWVASFCLTLLKMALELAKENPVYEHSASKLFEHFLRIAEAVNDEDDVSLWDERDGFYYDRLYLQDGTTIPLKVRSMVGLLSLTVVETLDEEVFENHPTFARRVDWFLHHRPHISNHTEVMRTQDGKKRRLLAFLSDDKLRRLLEYLLDEAEFLSDYGIRSLSRYHESQPFSVQLGQRKFSIHYEPAESSSRMFGGNSNWRGPVWFPINYLLIESLQKFHHFYGDDFKVEFPTGSGRLLNLDQVASELSRRLCELFLEDNSGRRPVYGGTDIFREEHWNKHILFYEYFHGDNGAGLGASHQTGWTGLVAKLLQDCPGKAARLTEDRSAWHKMLRLNRFWKDRSDNASSNCVQQELLKILLEKGTTCLTRSVQPHWPLNAETAFGAIPTPLRLHADPRFSGKGITIAFIDSDFYPHPDLVEPQNRIKALVDTTKSSTKTYRFEADETPRWPGWDKRKASQWHGMMTSTCAAGNGHLSEGFYRGLASDSEVVLIRTINSKGHITDAAIQRALDWVEKNHEEFGIKVVNLSVSADPVREFAENPIDNSINRLVQQGVVVTAAAGNEGVRRLNPPATSPSALTVGGIDDKNTFDRKQIKLWHSNFGSGGGGVHKPEIVAPSLWVVSCIMPGSQVEEEAQDLFQDPEANQERIRDLKLVSPHYKHVDGTSFAAPIVASACACIMEACPGIAPHSIREALIKTAQTVKDADEARQGHGVVRPGLALAYAVDHFHQHKTHVVSTPHLENGRVTFLYHDHSAGVVEIAGSWDRWKEKLEMVNVEPGIWKLDIKRPRSGTHYYKFILNRNQWVDDPANPLKEPDHVGGFNSVLKV